MGTSFQDRFFLVRLTRDERKVRTAFFIIATLVVILLGNTLYLTVLSVKQEKSTPLLVVATPTPSPTPEISLAPSPVPVVVPVTSNSSPTVREYFISFGSGTNQSSDWVDVPGLSANVDFGSYPRIKEVRFEASVVIPTANESASVRLFNTTDQHPVWYSEITLENGQFVSSSPIIYDTGSKSYKVQMKTSLQFPANLVQSRLHIILQ